MLWKSPHPDLDLPENITTWEWVFESPEYSPVAQSAAGKLPKGVGSYSNAATNERLDYAQVKDKSTKLSTVLIRKYGLKAGDTVSLFSSNTIWYPVGVWATIRAGGRVNGASPAYNSEEMAHALKTANTKVLLTLPPSLPVAVAAARNAGISTSHVLLLEGTGSVDGTTFSNIQSLISLAESDPKYSQHSPAYQIPNGQTNKSVCAYLNFSSGTTGLPKAVMLSHHNIIAQCHQLRQLQVLPKPRPDNDNGRYRILAIMPLFHITGLVRFVTYPVFMNGDCIMLPNFTMPAMLDAIIKYRIEELILVPPIVIRMVRDPIVNEPKYLPKLQEIVKRWSSGSAPTSPEIINQLHQKFPNTGFRQGYGATESTACISAHPPSHFDYRYANTGGMLVANTIAKVISLSDPSKMLGPGETGEICAKGPQIAMGYLGNDAATRETFDSGGFLHTGDVGHIDEEGLIHIEDRIKEMIKVKGIQVAPAELEDLLLGMDEVEDCAVLSIPDEYSGERPKAFVVLKEKFKTREHEMGIKLHSFVREKKVKFKWLKEIEFADAVPKSPTGKLLRRVLKDRERDTSRQKGVLVKEETRDIKAKL